MFKKICGYSGVALFVLLLFGSWLTVENFVFAITDSAESKLDTANKAFEQAFRSVLEAENAGVNVTYIVNQLNHAAELLAQAENLYSVGDLETAGIHADSVILIAKDVSALAQDAKQSALITTQNNFWFTMVFTIIGICIFLFVLVISWRIFRRHYIKKLYTAKPEVKDY